MYQRNVKRKFLKPDQRARIWTHQIKEAALAAAGQGLGKSLGSKPLRRFSRSELEGWLTEPAMQADYRALVKRLNDLAADSAEDQRPKSAPEVDCYTLYALTKAIGATRALEIGTHLGFSTLHIAAALSEGAQSPKLTTVDIIDVNCETSKPWISYGANLGARQRITAMGLAERVEFVIGDSDAFLKSTPETYDMIFVDGDHSEVGAYFDIAHGLARLSENGIMVLHDAFDPNNAAHDAISFGQYGVHWAVQRVKAHVPDIDIIRLGEVTIPGAAAPTPTSLAVITKG
jgi:predicted O-methyltransferase YrrM